MTKSYCDLWTQLPQAFLGIKYFDRSTTEGDKPNVTTTLLQQSNYLRFLLLLVKKKSTLTWQMCERKAAEKAFQQMFGLGTIRFFFCRYFTKTADEAAL